MIYTNRRGKMAESLYDKLITFNVYKQEPTVKDMTSLFNGRVGDQGVRLAVRWVQGEPGTLQEVDVINRNMFGSVHLMVGNGVPDGNGDINMDVDASGIDIDSDPANNLPHGITVFKLPQEAFPKDGFAKGYFALKDNLGNVWSSIDVWFKVKGGTPYLAAKVKYFSDEWNAFIAMAKKQNDDFANEMRGAYNQQVTDAQNALTRATANLSSLAGTAGNIEAQITAQDIITRPEYNRLATQINDTLANFHSNPESLADLNAVKAKYPNGTDNFIVTDDGHRAVYRNGQWIDGGIYQAAGIKASDVYNSMLTNQNYLTDPTFAVNKPFKDDQTSLSVKNINDTNWLSVVSSTGGGIGLEAKNVNDGLFQVWAKRLQFDLSNHANTWQTFNVEVQVYNVDDNSTVEKAGIGSFTVKPLTAYHINLKFNLPTPKFTNRYYRIFIFSNTASVDYDIANPVLKNEYKELPHDNNLLDVTNPLSPIGNVQITTYYDAGKRYGNVTTIDTNAENKGVQQIFELKPYGSGYGDKFRVQTEIRNEGKSGTIVVELRYLNADGSIGSSQLINRSILGTSQSIEINRVIKLSTSEYAKNYQEASLAIYEENSADTHLLVNLDKTSVNYEANVTETSQNLFGNWKTNHVISDGSTATDYYNDAETLNVYFDGKEDYSTLMLPMNYNSSGIIDINLRLVSNVLTKLKFELNEYNVDGSIKHINELRPETLRPGIVRTVHINYNVTETNGAYYALVVYSQKEQLSFMILDAYAKMHDSTQKSSSSLPQVNLLANLDEGGAIAKGMVELIRGDVRHLYYATFKIQGDSTKTFPKKAWRITFYTDDTYKTKLPVRVFPDYPDVDSLNMKSNYIDWTQANNILVSRCIADLTKLSDGIENKQIYAPNQCEITGEACIGYNNGQKLGLFTLSPKKSNVMFNMEKGNTKMAVFEGNNVTEENCFKADSTEFGDDKPFTIEATDDDVDQSLKDSFNALLKLVNSSTDDDFKAQISSKLNLQSVANWIVSIIAFGLYDNTAKNICWATWDGVKWSAVQYDHDMAFGLWWDGSRLNHEESDIDLPYLIKFSRLFERLIKLHLIDDQLISAWDNLKTAHSMIELQKEFRDWYYRIGDVNYEEDQRIWPDMPGQHYFHGEHVLNYIAKRYKHCDKWFTKDYLATL